MFDRPATKATVWTAFGVFFVIGAIMGFVLMAQESARWKQLRDHGIAVQGIVSEKHTLESELDDGDSRFYYRLFFLPSPDLAPDAAALWARTSVATRYPASVELFDDWGNRLWDDVDQDVFAGVTKGQEFVLWIDGADAMIEQPEGPSPRGWIVSSVFLMLGIGCLAMAVRARLRRASSEGGRDAVA